MAASPPDPWIGDAVNELRPWSGRPVADDALTIYKGAVAGFRDPGCRTKFETAVDAFEAALQRQDHRG